MYLNLRQKGLSLIELLVSMLIASIVLAGVVSVVATSRSSFIDEQESSFIQENARFALEMLSRDLRLAGNKDCAPETGSWSANIVGIDATGLYSIDPITGYEGTTLANFATFPLALNGASVGSDAIIIRYGDPEYAIPIKNHNTATFAFTFHTDHTFAMGDKLMVVDAECRNFGYFENRTSSNDTVMHTATGSNCTSSLYSKQNNVTCPTVSSTVLPYKAGSVVMPFNVSGYFIDESDIISGIPALKRRIFNGTEQRTEELAQGIESMEILYGVDESATPDNEVDVYISANDVADWETVIAVRFTLIFRSQSEIFDADGSVTLNGTTYIDKYLRQVASSTVRIRNRGQ